MYSLFDAMNDALHISKASGILTHKNALWLVADDSVIKASLKSMAFAKASTFPALGKHYGNAVCIGMIMGVNIAVWDGLRQFPYQVVLISNGVYRPTTYIGITYDNQVTELPFMVSSEIRRQSRVFVDPSTIDEWAEAFRDYGIASHDFNIGDKVYCHYPGYDPKMVCIITGFHACTNIGMTCAYLTDEHGQQTSISVLYFERAEA